MKSLLAIFWHSYQNTSVEPKTWIYKYQTDGQTDGEFNQ